MSRFATVKADPVMFSELIAPCNDGSVVATISLGFLDANGRRLVRAREQACAHQRLVAAVLGMSVFDLARVEAGILRFADPADYERAARVIAGDGVE